MFSNKIIFIAPIDWGLGHATRCVPIIKQLQKDNVVILGITPQTELIFNQEFPELKKIPIQAYNITYSKAFPAWLALSLQSFKIYKVIQTENKQLREIILNNHIDVVISDNRFGLYDTNITSIYITHQLNIKAGVLSFLANLWHHHYIKKYNQVWVPDYKDKHQRLAGELSANKHLKNVSYINPLSRLTKKSFNTTIKFDYLCVLSGPEPQRSILENELIKLSRTTTKKIGIARASNTMMDESVLPENITILNTPSADELSQAICEATTVICRSGYSSLMDMHQLQKTDLVLIPTPGQTEQIYLAHYWKQKFNAKVINQKNIRQFTF